ncbi:peptidylprolyl isomerase [Halobacteriovorax marinus]|uniref:Peptidyl-prolyl cis-trans isomerase n=1 Tax=Halobacteriovorax marinus (strain ATCC BAA-682 / DSM 15412 / SJ) TaxID=862908 RepID=E1X2G1_HALMS|nr:peptidylprolyl isomerase [Halobacteriovorax marinus]ATH08076.1 peptidylprolyl isomerase [Halobacteriovorax marinus]CBW26728.1 FKBP-type peptidyl-prolyl cis-trans isomerase [Halobacteriovorax marinus SJ]
MKVQNDHVIEINYTLKSDSGETIDTSDTGGPLFYLHGRQNIIPGLESALTGKEVNDKVSVRIEPKDAYGERVDQLIQKIEKAQFPNFDDMKVGQQLQVQTEDGHPLIVTIIEKSDDGLTLDGNHPLAGMNLNFDVEIKSVRVATENELSHGHVHGDGSSCEHNH